MFHRFSILKFVTTIVLTVVHFFSLIFPVWIFHLNFPASVFTSNTISFAPSFHDKFFAPVLPLQYYF